jgi:hypothetical protein
MNLKVFGRKQFGRIKALSWRFPEETEKNHEKSQSEWLMSRMRFKLSICQYELVTSMPANPVT